MSRKVGVYRFYNMKIGKEGEPFGLCKEHFKKQVIPDCCTLTKLSADGFLPCGKCTEREE